MTRHILKFRALIVLCLVFVLFCSEAYAWGGWKGGGHHYYREGRWYRHGWLWFDTTVTTLAIGALVDNLPPRHTTVVYNRTPYYYCDGYYYRPYSYGGYVVVSPPVVAQPVVVAEQPKIAAVQAPDIITINIPNSRGAYMPVMLRRSGNGYIGPQGEYYSRHPTVEQLKILYGGR